MATTAPIATEPTSTGPTSNRPGSANGPASAGGREKRGLAVASLLATTLLALLKLAVGLWTGSLGMLSEAAHSGVDCVSSLLTVMSVRVADKPADADHPYGHGKIENISAFIQTFLMLGSAAWISIEAIQRLWHHEEPLRLSLWPFAVLLLSIAVDLARAAKLRRAAQKLDSAALQADAAHFGIDVLTSVAVLAGLLCVELGHRFGIPQLAYADSVAALLVAAVIVGIAWRLALTTTNALLDSVPEAEQARIAAELAAVPGVLSVDRVRLRKSGARYYSDITLGMARNLTFQRSEQLVRDATLAVQRVLPESDVVVHPLPRASGTESVFDRVRAVAHRHNVSVHDLSMHDFEGTLRAELHLEVPERTHLRAAHDFVTVVEEEILRECPELGSVLTHIESELDQIEHPQTVERDDALEATLRLAAEAYPQVCDVHDVTVRRVGEHLYVSCHCTLPDEMPMAEVHLVITDLEARCKQLVPAVTRVFIHPEPMTDNRR